VEELESNARMESFQNWYNIYYKEFEGKSNGKQQLEMWIMNQLKIKYHDNTMIGGCIGELLNDIISKLLENMQKRSKDNQRLHLTKSRPEKDMHSNRRVVGDYYVIQSDHAGKPIGWASYNVST
jgi:hypothetical protein